MTDVPATTRQLRSLVDRSGEVRLSLETVDTPQPGPHQVLVRVEAAPINPSDLALMLAMADVDRATSGGTPDEPAVTAPISEKVMPALRGRVGASMPVGNEGSGVVVAAGDSEDAQALLGKTVAFLGEGTYGEHALTNTRTCLPLPDGTAAADGASSFVNPLTAQGMVETMRREGHTGLVHTAAASNLGQMLNRICLADGVPLVNVVRRPEQAALLRDQGAEHVCDSSAETFFTDLVAALEATGATIAFDAVGGGELASQILNAMEAAVTDPEARTAATAPTCTSRSTCTAGSTGARWSSVVASGSPGRWEGGCSCRSSPRCHPRTLGGCSAASPTSWAARSPATTATRSP